MTKNIDDLNTIISKFEEIHQKEIEVEQAKLELSDLILKFKEEFPDFATNLSTNSPHEGVYYSFRIKEKGGQKIAYLCACRQPFGSWLKKKAA